MAVPQAEIEQRMRHFEDVCRRHGLRVTHQRTEIFRELAASEEHPDAETLYQRVHRRIPAVSVDTVYRTLGVLEARQLVRKAEVRSGPARYDANMDHHHHFTCTACGAVRDVPGDRMGHVTVPRAVKGVGTVTSCDVQLRGLCLRCARRKKR